MGVRTEWLLGIAHQFSEAIFDETLIIDKGARHQCVGNMLLIYLLVRPKGLLLLNDNSVWIVHCAVCILGSCIMWSLTKSQLEG